jgi:hypothetical protein
MNGEMEGLRATSNDNSTRLSVVLTPWPPGPLDLENRHRNSAAGIVKCGKTTRSAATSDMRTSILDEGSRAAADFLTSGNRTRTVGSEFR